MSSSLKKVAVILIDIQDAFVHGAWSRFVQGVKRIDDAFKNTEKLMHSLPETIPVLLTQCPFYNPKDREFHESVKEIFRARRYPIIYKFDTNIMDAEGIDEWMDAMLAKNIDTFVIGGCTTTSCVRVSSSALSQHFKNHPVQFVVDLNLCGAKDANYVKRCQKCIQLYLYGRVQSSDCQLCKRPNEVLSSPVDLAVKYMSDAGVKVVEMFDWSPYKLKEH